MNIEKGLEIEVKIKVESLPPWREKLIALGAAPQSPRAFERNLVFDTLRNVLKKRGMLLRLRAAGGRNILTMKLPVRPDAVYKIREETETEVGDFQKMEMILRGIGFRRFFAYEKYREVLLLEGVRVMLDETPIGPFIEIEGEPAAIDGTAALLGFCRDDYITDSYHRLFILSGRSGDMVFPR